MGRNIQKAVQASVTFLGSRYFLGIVIGLFILQASWVALSFRYPLVYDEIFHLPVIKIYAQQWSPLILNQPVQYDRYQNLSNGDAGLFHYLMSFPYRTLDVFIDSDVMLTVFMRLAGIMMVALGLLLYYKTLKQAGVASSYVNTGLLVFTLIPIVTLTAATVNYDNLLFLLTGAYLLVSVKILMARSGEVDWRYLAGLLAIGSTAVLVKYTFLPIFAFSVIYIAILLVGRRRHNPWPSIRESFSRTSLAIKAALIAVLVLSLLPFIGKYTYNIFVYQDIKPSCVETLGLERCKANSVVLRGLQMQATKGQRPVSDLPAFSMNWMQNMTVGSTSTAANLANGKLQGAPPMPVIYHLVFYGVIASVLLIAYAWRDIFRTNHAWRYLTLLSAALIVVLFITNARGYYEMHAALANQPRYLLTVVPIVITGAIAATGLLMKHQSIKLLAFLVILLAMTQGGGVITHIVRSNSQWYWENSIVQRVNTTIKDVVKPLIVI